MKKKSTETISIRLGDVSVPLKELESQLRKSVKLREEAPLAVDQLVRFLLSDDEDTRELSEQALRFLNECCRPNELHTMLLDAWTWLWQQSDPPHALFICPDEDPCILSNARSTVADLIVDILLRTQKGALFKYQGNHMLSFVGQLISKHWLPEARECRHPISHPADMWVESVLRSSHYFLCPQHMDSTRVAVNIEVGIRLMSAVLEAISRQPAGMDPSMLLSCLFQVFGYSPACDKYLEAKFNTMDIFNPSIAPALDVRSADLELFDSDIALLVTYSRGVRNPCLIPQIWAPQKRAEILIKNICVNLMSEDHVGLGLKVGGELLEGRDICSVPVAVLSRFFQLMIERATGWGSEENFALTDRQGVFKKISACMGDIPVGHAKWICESMVTNSRSDGCVGLAVKMAKDSVGNDHVEFFKFAKLIFPATDDFDLINGMDSLKSILNWARLVLGGCHVDRGNIPWFAFKLDALAKQVDLELLAIEDKKSIQCTRVLFIGHLVGVVRELVRGGWEDHTNGHVHRN